MMRMPFFAAHPQLFEWKEWLLSPLQGMLLYSARFMSFIEFMRRRMRKSVKVEKETREENLKGKSRIIFNTDVSPEKN